MTQSDSTLRKRIFNLLEMPDTLAARTTNVLLMLLIFANVVAVALETMQDMRQAYAAIFDDLEFFSVMVFTVEYLLRAWVCIERRRFRRLVAGRLRYMLTPLAIIDLLAILPFYLSLMWPIDTRILRVFRLVRIFKLTRYFAFVDILFKVIRNELKTLGAALFILLTLMVLASAGMYLAEREIQPEAFGNIPRAMWWATITLTTVGYGDVVPLTVAGRLFGTIITILGIGIAALPAGIIAAGFTQELQNRRDSYRIMVRSTLEGGTISEQDRHLLEHSRKTLGIDREEANIVLKNEAMKILPSRLAGKCPHCGESLELPAVEEDHQTRA